MCTNEEMKVKLSMYMDVSEEIKKMEAVKKQLAAFILDEMEARKTDSFQDVKIITERLTETATAAGRQALKNLYRENIDKYMSVSCSRFVNTRNVRKVV